MVLRVPVAFHEPWKSRHALDAATDFAGSVAGPQATAVSASANATQRIRRGGLLECAQVLHSQIVGRPRRTPRAT
jgi:hypothetical protein